MVSIMIDSKKIDVESGSTILEAAQKAGIKIPTLCYLKEVNNISACRVCVVEVEGVKNLQPACSTQVRAGMKIFTNSRRVREARKTVVRLILSDHPQDCLSCARNRRCELRQLVSDLGMTGENEYAGYRKVREKDQSNPSVVRDPAKCILCRRCETVCHEIQGVGAVGALNRGFETVIAPAFNTALDQSVCVMCGQCINVCPTGALTEKSYIEEVWKAIFNPDKHVVVQVAPAVRIALGEEFDMEPGAIVTKKMVSALKMLGFDRVFDTDFTADLTIMEEGSELLERLNHGGVLPMITSCSPGWINFIETFYPQMLPHLSSCKSPQQMFGAVMKTYYAGVHKIDPEKIVTVSVMPCTAKKYECERPEMRDSGYKDVDAVLTTREVAAMIREAGIDWNALIPREFDAPFGEGSGAGVIFGASGGVMEAALRTVYEIATGEPPEKIEFEDVRGLQGLKEAEVKVGETTLRVAVANGLKNAREVLNMVQQGKEYHFIEIMACPGGCLGGGGQPLTATKETLQKRMAAVYEADKLLPVRKAHENPYVQALYKDFLGKPLGEKSHKLLHTHYAKKKKG